MKIKVLRIITRLNNGGPAKQAVWLTSRLDSNNFEKHLVAGQVDDVEDDIFWFAKKQDVEPIYVEYLKRDLNIRSDIRAFIRIYRIISRIQPDLVHTHMSKAGMLGRCAAIVYNVFRKRKIKIIHTFHGHIFHSYFSKLKTALFIMIEKLISLKTDVLIAISQKQKSEIRDKIGGKDKFRVIPLGVDYTPVVEGVRRNGSIVIVGMMGRIAEIKNYSLALDIAEKMKEGRAKAVIEIAGGGSLHLLQSYRELIQRKGLNGYVRFLGNIDRPELFWKNIDIALITSRNEGTPVSLIESMMNGIPFVASNVGGIIDMANGFQEEKGKLLFYRNCILVNSFNPEDFLEGLKYYIDNENKRLIASEECKSFAQDKYTLSRLVGDIEELYMELIEKE